ncbi:serine acetyltransferase [bacterium]|nr:serine acetyltransferase [bacterium]
MTGPERSQRIWELAESVAGTYRQDGVINRIGEKNLPSQAAIRRVLEQLLTLVFPGYHGDPVPQDADLVLFAASHLERLHGDLQRILEKSLQFSRRHGCSCAALWADGDGGVPGEAIPVLSSRLAMEYLAHLPRVRELTRADVEAAFAGDPAAGSTDEVVLCYPGVLAVAVHRLAHPLQRMGIPLVPRIMSEWAHQRTGVDIHPGATIGRSFFIDHGTGVVIGETAEIGEHVKLYQGVTIGALSFERNPDGSLAKGGKRHPTLEDHVTVYAGATLLGGETVIGRGAIIGGGAWITAPVPAGARVSARRRSVMVADDG